MEMSINKMWAFTGEIHEQQNIHSFINLERLMTENVVMLD